MGSIHVYSRPPLACKFDTISLNHFHNLELFTNNRYNILFGCLKDLNYLFSI